MSEGSKLLFLAAAYAVFWIGTFGYVFYMQRRLRALERELDEFKSFMDDRERSDID